VPGGLAAQVFEADDFGTALTPELREQEERLRSDLPVEQPTTFELVINRKPSGLSLVQRGDEPRAKAAALALANWLIQNSP
jgi:hypothetical protein